MSNSRTLQQQPSKDNDNEGLRLGIDKLYDKYWHSEMTGQEFKAELLALFAARTKSIEREAQLSILRGFRRRDFVSGDFYEHAVIDRITKLT